VNGSPKVAVAGAGAWGRNHVRTLHGLGALAGVVDVSAEACAWMRETYPEVPAWTSLAEACQGEPGLRGLVVATPAPTHTELTLEALGQGLGVLVEKPMTLVSGEARDLVERAEAGGSTLMVGHLLLYQPAIQELKRLLDGGVVGKVHRFHFERMQLGRVRSAENALWSLAPHDVAVLLHLAGEAPSTVEASGAAFLQPGIHDDVHLELTFPQGCSAHIHVGWYWPSKTRGIRVLGERGMIVYEEDGQTLTLHRKRFLGTHGPAGPACSDQGSSLVFQGEGEPLVVEDAHFLHCLTTGRTPLSDGRSGLDVIRVLERGDLSLRNLPTPPTRSRP